MKKQFFLLTLSMTGTIASHATNDVEQKAKAFYAAFDAADANTLHSMASGDFKFYNPFTPEPLDISGLIAFSTQTAQSFSDNHHRIRQVIATENSATIIGTFTATNSADFNGIPATHKNVSVDFISVLQWDKNGHIASMTAQNNSYSFMTQLGAIPSGNGKNTNAVMDIYQLFGKGDIPGLVNSLDPNIVWDSHVNPFVQGARIYSGSQDVYHFFGSLKESTQITEFIPVHFYESGDLVYVLGSFTYIPVKDEKKYHVNWTMTWHFTNG